MPAIVVENVALNYTSMTGLGASTSTVDYLLPFPMISSVKNESEDSWPFQLSTEDSSYPNFPANFFGYFEDVDDDFGSPLPFDAGENGLWNGRFVPPPPRPPFLEESIMTDGITTCDLCSWARPVKSTVTAEGSIQKATELWLYVGVAGILSLILGAMLIVICQRKRKKSVRNETNSVQWWSRNKQRPHLQSSRRNNIYTGNPADSIRGLPSSIHQQNFRRNTNHQSNINNNNHETETCHWSNVTSCVVNS